MRITSKGLKVWDLTTDPFSHADLAANWDLVDSLFNTAPTTVEVRTTLPTTALTAGRLCMLSVAVSGFAAWTLVRYDGSAWRAVGPFEILPAVPTTGNYAGRIIILSATDSGFSAWSVIRYDGTAWGVVGGFTNINTGAGALNIQGLQTTGDLFYSVAARGPVLVDRNTGTFWRLFIIDGKLEHEIVT